MPAVGPVGARRERDAARLVVDPAGRPGRGRGDDRTVGSAICAALLRGARSFLTVLNIFAVARRTVTKSGCSGSTSLQLGEHAQGDLELGRVDAARGRVGEGIGGGHTEFYAAAHRSLPSGVEAEAELAQEAGQPLAIGAREGVRAGAASASTRRVIAASTRVRPSPVRVTRMLRPSSGSASRSHEPPRDEPVDAVGHRAARDEGLLQQLLRAQLERLARAAEGREHVPLPRLEVAAPERVATRPVEVAREAVDAREHLERREVEVGPLRDPCFDDAVDFVRLVRHVPIIGARHVRSHRSRCATRRSGRLEGGALRSQAGAAVRRGVMAARQPLELLGLGSSPGGGACLRTSAGRTVSSP